MKTKTFALVLLAIFVVSSLEVVWADEDIYFDELNVSDEASINEFSDFEENEVDDEVDILSKGSCKKGKKVKSNNYVGTRCVTSECKKICKEDEFTNGKCIASEKSDKVKKCYCLKSCEKKEKKVKKGKKDKKGEKGKKEKKGKKDKNSPSTPVDPPFSAPDTPPFDISPASAPDTPPVDISPSSTPDFPPVDVPSSDLPDISPIDFPPTETPTTYESFEDDDSDIIFS